VIKTTTKVLIILWLGVFLFGTNNFLFSQNDLFFNELTSRNGLEDTKVVFVYKDTRGFTWIGALGGLYRFDGLEVIYYGEAKGVDEPYLQGSMLEDTYGNLWFCAYNKLFCYERMRDTCLSFGGFQERKTKETLDDYGLITLDEQNQLWLTAGQQLFQVDLDKTLLNKKLSFQAHHTGEQKIEGKRFLPLINAEKQFTGFVEFFFIGSGMRIWHKNADHSFQSKHYFTSDNGKLPALKVKQVLPIQDKPTEYLLCTSLGLVLFDGTKENLGQFFALPNRINITFAIYFQPGLVLCSTSDGLYFFNLRSKTFSKAKDWSANLNTSIISRNNFRELQLDRDGILWGLAFDEGLCYADPKMVKASFTDLPFRVECLQETANGGLLIGSENGFYLMKKNGERSHFLPDERINAFYKDRNQQWIWVITEKCLYTFEPSTSKLNKMIEDTGFPWSLYQSSDGTYWVGNIQGVKKFNLDRGNKMHINSQTAQLLGDRNIWEDTLYQRLYLQENLSNLHVYHYQQGNWLGDTSFSIKGQLGGYLIPRGSNKIWVATIKGIKLIHRTKLSIEDLPIPSYWPSSNITGMLQDQAGIIWVSTNANLLSFSPHGKPLHVYNTQEGLFAAPFQYETLRRLSDNSLVIAGRYGFSRFYPQQMEQHQALPKVQLTRLLVQGRPFHEVFPTDTAISEKNYIRLKYKQNTISLRLIGIEFGQPGNVKIQYYLQGLEKQAEASIRDQVAEPRYGKLAPRRYVMMVRVANANGVWSAWEAKIHIEIIPPIYMRWWFMLLALLLFSLGIVGVVQLYYRAQLRDARVRNEEQERILRDIHDLTSGKVVFFQDFREFAQDKIPQVEFRAKALNIAEQALQLFKRISSAVRNSKETDSTLLEFLHQLITESRKMVADQLAFEAQLDASIPYRWVAGESKKHLNLVIQEALGNILKHANATQVQLSAKVVDGKLHIVLKDNGSGIPDAVVAQIKPTATIKESGNGLGNMLWRMNSIGGHIEWINQHGTSVIISIPLQKVQPKRRTLGNFNKLTLL